MRDGKSRSSGAPNVFAAPRLPLSKSLPQHSSTQPSRARTVSGTYDILPAMTISLTSATKGSGLAFATMPGGNGAGIKSSSVGNGSSTISSRTCRRQQSTSCSSRLCCQLTVHSLPVLRDNSRSCTNKDQNNSLFLV